MIRFRNIALTAALGAAACIGFWLEQPVALASDSSIAAAATPANDGKGKILFYRAPMSSDVSSVPKKDEMGMDYIPIYEGDASSEPGSVSLSAERIQKLGVRTAIVEQRDLMQPIHIVGTVQIDEARQTVIAPRFEGWIAKLYVNTTFPMQKVSGCSTKKWLTTALLFALRQTPRL